MRLVVTCEEYSAYLSYLRDGSLPAGLPQETRSNFYRKARCFQIGENGRLYVRDGLKNLEIIAHDDLDRLTRVFHELHNPRHLGMTKMYQILSDLYAGFCRSTID